MTHTFDTKNRVAGTSNPLNVSITPTTGATILVLGIQIHETTARTGGAPTFNGETLTQVGTVETAVETNCEMWYLADPSIGTYNIVIPNTNTRELRAVGSVYKAQAGYSSGLDVTDGTNLTSENPSLTVVTTEDGCVLVDVMGNGQLTPPNGSTHTELYSVDNGSDSDNHQYGLQTSAGEITFGWTESLDDWCMILAAFKEIAGTLTSTDVLHGKLQILDIATSTVDGKVEIKDSHTTLADGKLKIKDAISTLCDGKLRIKDLVVNLADGKVKITKILGQVTNIFDGLLQIPGEYNIVMSSEEQHTIQVSSESQHNIVMIRDEE